MLAYHGSRFLSPSPYSLAHSEDEGTLLMGVGGESVQTGLVAFILGAQGWKGLQNLLEVRLV